MAGEILDPTEEYGENWHPKRNYTPEEAVEEADRIKLMKQYSDKSYDELEKIAEVSALTDKIKYPEYNKVVNATKNGVEFTEEHQNVINEQIQRLDCPEEISIVIKQLRSEGIENGNIVLFLQDAINQYDFDPILHRAEMFSEKSERLRQILGLKIDTSEKPERYLYHGTKATFPKLSDNELKSFMTTGIMGTQMGGVSGFVGTKGLATTIVMEQSVYGANMFRMNTEFLTRDGYDIMYYDNKSDSPFGVVQLPQGESIPPKYIEYRIDSLGVYVPLNRVQEIQEAIKKYNEQESGSTDVNGLAKPNN